MISIYNKLEQCRNILRDLRLHHPGVTLPVGLYGMKDRPLDKACIFLERELEGLMRDSGCDPSAGETRPGEAPDGK